MDAQTNVWKVELLNHTLLYAGAIKSGVYRGLHLFLFFALKH